MALGQLAKTLTSWPVSQDGVAIKSQRLTPDMRAFQFGTAHTSSHSLDDQIAFQLSDGPDHKAATVNRELACLRAMFNHAIKGDDRLKNPISKTATKVFREGNEQTRVIKYEEEKRYLAAASPVLHDVATVMLETGMRPEEVYRIRPENVHLAQNYLFNPYGKTKAAKRRIKLTARAKSIVEPRMRDAAERAAKNEGNGAFLFPRETDATRPLPGIQSPHARGLARK